MRLSELFLEDGAWLRAFASRPSAPGRAPTVVELGCGLGLPSLVLAIVLALVHGLPPRAVLTDRAAIARLAAEGVRKNRETLAGIADVRVEELEWTESASVRALKDRHLDGAGPDVILGCDVVFEPLFGGGARAGGNPLLEVLGGLARDDTVVLLALERRKDDGIDAFFREAALAGYAYEVLRAVDGVMIVEMARRPAK